MDPSDLSVERVRHTIKPRLLRVQAIKNITPKLVGVTFHCEDLAGFVSSSFDDHIKLFFPIDGKAVMPAQGPQGVVFPEGIARPPARDYTPRRFNSETKTLDIEFVLHGDGPAANWVAQASVGDELITAGPRGSFVIPTRFDWQWLIGDETALPAIARRLEELPTDYPVSVVALIEDEAEQQVFDTRANAQITWIHRSTASDSLETAVRKLDLPVGEGYIWGAGEAAQMRAIHRYLTEEKGVDKSRIRASSYWKQGAQAVHETHGSD